MSFLRRGRQIAVVSVPTTEQSGLTNEHCSDSETHQEEAPVPVQQVHLVLHLIPIAVDDRNCDHSDESVEGVEGGKLEFVTVDEGNTETDLNEHGHLSESGEEPQCSRAHRFDPMRTQGPQSSEAVGNDHEPGPGRVEIEQHQCIHDWSDASGRAMGPYIERC